MKSTRALLLAGDRAHDPGYVFDGIGAALGAEGIEVDCTSDYKAIGAETLADKDLFVVLRSGVAYVNGPDAAPVPWIQPDQEEAIEGFVLQGGGFLALHNAGWGYPWKDGYRRTLGGYYIGHPPRASFHVEVVNHDHPVTDGVEDYDIVDEQHLLHCDYDRVEMLLVSQGQDGRQSVSGWAHEYGKGRVVFLPHGHKLDEIRHPSNQKLLRNAARWLLRQT